MTWRPSRDGGCGCEEGEAAVAGVGGAFGNLGGLAEGAAALAPTAGEVAGTLAGAAGVGAAATAGLAVGIAGGAAYGLACGTGWILENTLFRPQQGSEDAAVQDVRSANNMNDATQPQHFTLRTGSSTSGSPKAHVLVRGLCGSAEAFLGNCLQRRALQRLRVGVLAGLRKIVQVEVACDEQGGFAVRLIQGQRLVPLQVAHHLLKARALVEAVRPERLHLLLRNFVPFHAPARPARSAAGVPGGARPPSAGSRRPGAAAPPAPACARPTSC